MGLLLALLATVPASLRHAQDLELSKRLVKAVTGRRQLSHRIDGAAHTPSYSYEGIRLFFDEDSEVDSTCIPDGARHS